MPSQGDMAFAAAAAVLPGQLKRALHMKNLSELELAVSAAERCTRIFTLCSSDALFDCPLYALSTVQPLAHLVTGHVYGRTYKIFPELMPASVCRILPKAQDLLARMKKQCELRFEHLTSSPPPGGDKDDRLRKIMDDDSEMAGVRELAAGHLTGRKAALVAQLDELADECKDENEYMAKLNAIAANSKADPGLRHAAVNRLNQLTKVAKGHSCTALHCRSTPPALLETLLLAPVSSPLTICSCVTTRQASQERSLMKVVGEVSVEAALAALPKHLKAAQEANDIIEIESLLNRTRAVIILAKERGCPPPAPVLVALVGNLEKTREKLQGEETDSLEGLLRLLHKAHINWGLLEQYDAIVEAGTDARLMGIAITLKMHQICEERREELLYEMQLALVSKRRTEATAQLESMVSTTQGDDTEARLKGVFLLLKHRHRVWEPTVGFDVEAIFELPLEEYSLWLGVAACGSMRRDEAALERFSRALNLAVQA